VWLVPVSAHAQSLKETNKLLLAQKDTNYYTIQNARVIKALTGVTTRATKVLNITVELKNRTRQVQNATRLVSTTVKALSYIPKVGKFLKPVDKAVGEFQSKVGKLMKKIEKVDKKIKPFRIAYKPVPRLVKVARQANDSIKSLNDTYHRVLLRTYKCVRTLPAGSLKNGLARKLEQSSIKALVIYKELNKVLRAINESSKKSYAVLQTFDLYGPDFIKFYASLSRPFNKLRFLRNMLRELDLLLRKKITIRFKKKVPHIVERKQSAKDAKAGKIRPPIQFKWINKPYTFTVAKILKGLNIGIKSIEADFDRIALKLFGQFKRKYDMFKARIRGWFTIPQLEAVKRLLVRFQSINFASLTIQVKVLSVNLPHMNKLRVQLLGIFKVAKIIRCYNCQAGTYLDGKSNRCLRCRKGTYSKKNSLVCSACPKGKRSNLRRTGCIANKTKACHQFGHLTSLSKTVAFQMLHSGHHYRLCRVPKMWRRYGASFYQIPVRYRLCLFRVMKRALRVHVAHRLKCTYDGREAGYDSMVKQLVFRIGRR
jgi:hypothetical protein